MNQKNINRIGNELERKLVKVVTDTVDPTDRDAVAATICALASVLTYIAVSSSGEKDAPRMISEAVNNALLRVKKQNENE